MKTALCLYIITIKILIITADDQNKNEEIDEMLDTLVKQTESGNKGIVMDRKTNKGKNSDVIYLKANNSFYPGSANEFENSRNTIKSRIDQNSKNDFSEEIVMEFKEATSKERNKNTNIENDPVANNDEPIKIPARRSEDPDEDRDEEPVFEEYQEMMLDASIDNDNRKNMAQVLKDMFVVPKDNPKAPIYDDNKPDFQKTLRSVFPDIGNPASSFKQNKRAPVEGKMPSRDPMQEIPKEQVLDQILRDQAYVFPFATPPPSIIRTIIHHSGFGYRPPIPYWQTGCCMP